MKTLLTIALAAALATLAACTAEQPPLEEARDAFFATVDGTDEDCEAWLQWCLDEGYPEEGCLERSEYCVDGEWAGGEEGERPEGDDDDAVDPCDEAATAAYDECIADGGSEEDCREVAAEAYDECAEQ